MISDVDRFRSKFMLPKEVVKTQLRRWLIPNRISLAQAWVVFEKVTPVQYTEQALIKALECLVEFKKGGMPVGEIQNSINKILVLQQEEKLNAHKK